MVNFQDIRLKHLIKTMDWHSLQQIAQAQDEESLTKLLTELTGEGSEYRKVSFDCRVDLKERVDKYCEDHGETIKNLMNTALELFFLHDQA